MSLAKYTVDDLGSVIWDGDTTTDACQPVLLRTPRNADFFDDVAAAIQEARDA